jgi:hypothetical protein
LPCPYFGSMKYNPVKQHRSIRLKDYDYKQPGAYFVTIVAYDRAGLFGDIVDGEVHLTRYGELVSTYGKQYQNIFLMLKWMSSWSCQIMFTASYLSS